MNKFWMALLAIGLVPVSVAIAQNDEAEIKEVVVTGTRIIRTNKFADAGHIVGIDEAAIDAMAELNIADVLRSSPLNSHGSFNEQSGNTAQSNATFNLRGLGSRRTLVLVDGMRIPGSPNLAAASVNINMLPGIAIQRIDILADGASAVYGSDAMSGVVNFVLHRNFEGIEVSARVSERTEDDGGDQSIGILAGFGTDKTNVVFSLEYSKRDPVFDRDRWYSEARIVDISGAPQPQIFIDTTGISHFGQTWEVFDPVTGYYELSASLDCPTTNGFTGVMGAAAFGLPNDTVCSYAFGEIASNRAELEKINAYVYAGYELSENAELYARGMIASNVSFGRFAPPAAPWPDPPADHAHNPFDLDQMIADGLITDQARLRGYYRWTNIGPRATYVDDFQWDIAVGVKGVMFDNIDFDFYAQSGRYDSDEIGQYFLYFPGLEHVVANDIDPFSEEGIEAMRGEPTQNNFTTQNKLTGHVQLDAWDSFGAGDSIVLLGIEYVEFAYEQKLDAASEAGLIGGSAGQSNGGERDFLSLFFEYLLPITERSELSIAGRWDDYSDFGLTFTPSIGYSNQLTDDLSLRLRWGEGFVAPDMVDLFGPSDVFPDIFYDPVMDVIRLAQSEYHSNAELQPETSTSISAGFNWEYFENHSIDVAYYQIDIENVISWTDTQDLVFADALGVQWDPAGSRVERTGGFVTNVVSYASNVNQLEASGVDIQLHSSFDTGWGYFDLSVLYALQLSYKENAYYDGGFQDTRNFENKPDTRAQASISWVYGDHAINLTANYIGRHAAENNDLDLDTGVITPSDEKYDAWIMGSLSYGYDAGKWGHIRVGANNITNEDPVINPIDPFAGTSRLYDKLGRVIFVEYDKRFN